MVETQNDPIVDVFEGWQRRLLQLDRQNNLLYFKPGRTATLIVDYAPDEIADRLDRSRRGLKFDYAEPRASSGRRSSSFEPAHDQPESPEPFVVEGDLRSDCPPVELQRKLGNLRRRSREWQEEQGLNVLSLALGFLRWIDEDGVEGSAPLLLLPAQLDRPSPRDAFVLTEDDEDITHNSTLAVKLEEFGIELPEYDSENQVPSEYLDTIRTLIASRDSWEVEESVYLTTFAYSKLSMWRDLGGIKETGTDNQIVRTLAGDTSSPPAMSVTPSPLPLEEMDRLDAGRLDDYLDIRDQFAVLPADYSQLIAITAARSGSNLVIHGPPGTGKSQTIANIIATSIADGKTVLFVSEKTAALDVVKKRLEDEGLGVFCLDMHSERGSKASVYDQIRQSVNDPRTVSNLGFDYESLRSLRDRLNSTVRLLHTRREPLGSSVFEMHGQLAQLRHLPHVEFDVPNVDQFTSDQVNAINELARRVSQHRREFREHLTSRWRILRISEASLELSNVIRSDMTVYRCAVETVESEADSIAAEIGTTSPLTINGVESLYELASHLSNAPGVPEIWLDPKVASKLDRIARQESRNQEDRRQILKHFKEVFRNVVPDLDYRNAINQLSLGSRDRNSLSQLIGDNYESRLVSSDGFPFESLTQIKRVASDLQERSASLASVLHADEPHRFIEAEKLVSMVDVVRRLNPVPEAWLTPDSIQRVRSDIDRARTLAQALDQAESGLFARFEPEIMDVVDREMVVRYRTNHQSRLKRLFGSYRSDRNQLRAHSLNPDNLDLSTELGAINDTVEVSRLRTEWSRHGSEISRDLGKHFRGRETDWDEIESAIDSLEKLKALWTGRRSALNDLLTDPDAAAECDSVSKMVEETLTELNGLIETTTFDGLYRLREGDSTILDFGSLIDECLPALERLRGPIKSLVSASISPFVDLSHVRSLVEDGARFSTLEQEHSQSRNDLSNDFGARYADFNTDWTEVIEALQWISNLRRILGNQQISERISAQCTSPRDPAHYREIQNQIELSLDAYGTQVEPLEARYDFGFRPDEKRFDEAKVWAEDLSQNADSAGDWIRYQIALGELEQSLSSGLVDQIRLATDDAELIPSIVLRRISLAWLDSAYRNEPLLAEFTSLSYDDVRARFQVLDKNLPLAARSEIRQKAFEKYPDRFATNTRAGQLGTLRHELNKSRKQMPVRRLFSRMPHLLQTIKPCFLVSPLAVSQYLPVSNVSAETLNFDLVIFDEASQVFPEDAVPAILRGKQLILAGDQKQLPPSNFWRHSMSDEDEYSGDEDEDDPDQLTGMESILDAAVGQIGTLFTEAHLNVHYRSRDERLIQFSNHHFYEDRLLTFPSPGSRDSWDGLHDTLVDGIYDAGGTATNRIEAEKVVDLVFDHMRTRPIDVSLGVVALSRRQADLIIRLIDERRLSERDLDSRFDESLDEPFFVKNLENVQGDERDHMILCIGYGPTASGKPYNRFGPINSKGGERRLNVAITRAKQRLTVVRSLRPHDITSQTQGARVLRRFLEFVSNPKTAMESEVTVDPSAEYESPFEEAVGNALAARGYRIRKQVGVAGYRVDLAILSEDGAHIDLGVECDGATYHSAPAARDRDWLRDEILRGLGWTIHRVWSTSWLRNPEAEIEAIENALQVARYNPPEPQNPTPPVLDTDVDAVGTASDTLDTLESAEHTDMFQFEKYEETRLVNKTTGPLQSESDRLLKTMIAKIAQVEGPVHRDIVIERLRVHYRLGKVRGSTRDRVIEAINRAAQDGLIIMQGEFVWESDDQLDRSPRRYPEGKPQRSIDQIPPSELRQVLLLTANQIFGGPKDDLISQAARNLGYRRTGAWINLSLDEIIEDMLKDGSLRESFGMIVAQD